MWVAHTGRPVGRTRAARAEQLRAGLLDCKPSTASVRVCMWKSPNCFRFVVKLLPRPRLVLVLRLPCSSGSSCRVLRN